MADHSSFTPDFAATMRTSKPDRGVVIEVRGELDSGTCDQLMETVSSAVADRPPRLTLDLQQMTFIDSAGTRTLIMIERLADEHGIPLAVTQPQENVTGLLRTAGIVDRMDLETRAARSSPPPSDFIERTELELPRDPHSPARARLEVRDCLAGRDQSELANVVLLTSELVTNAVVHPRGVGSSPIGLRITEYEDRIRVEVEDAGQGFDRVAPVPSEGERGRGLFLVDRFSNQWGSARVHTDAGPRFRVWFELEWRAQEAEAATG